LTGFEERSPEPAPRRRLVLLGASNLTLGLPIILGLLGGRSEPSEILVAAGHGRSFGRPSRVLARGLAGILDSGLWPALAVGVAVRTRALITDIGNDLAYGSTTAELEGWISACCDRLLHSGAEVTLTRPPLASLSRLGRWRFRLLKALLFPGHPLGYSEMLAKVEELDRRLPTLARRHEARLLTPSSDWYGIDRIHIRAGRRREAWATMLGSSGLGEVGAERASTRRVGWRPLTPERQTILGRERLRTQPSRHLGDGSRVSFF
jgi:hypothetical protein